MPIRKTENGIERTEFIQTIFDSEGKLLSVATYDRRAGAADAFMSKQGMRQKGTAPLTRTLVQQTWRLVEEKVLLSAELGEG